jgi:hypothetical protein
MELQEVKVPYGKIHLVSAYNKNRSACGVNIWGMPKKPAPSPWGYDGHNYTSDTHCMSCVRCLEAFGGQFGMTITA